MKMFRVFYRMNGKLYVETLKAPDADTAMQYMRNVAKELRMSIEVTKAVETA